MAGQTVNVQATTYDGGQHTTDAIFRLIYEQAAVGIALVAFDGRITHANAELGRFLGYQDMELTALTVGGITHPDDLPDSGEQFKRLLSGTMSSFRHEHRFLRKDGSIVWGHASVMIARNPTGKPICFIVNVSDVTARRTALVELAQAAARIGSILDNVADFVFVRNFDGAIAFANPVCLELLGWTAAEMVGHDFYKYVHPEDHAEVRAAMEKLYSGSASRVKTSFRGRHKADNWVPVDMTACAIPGPMGAAHEIAGIVSPSVVAERDHLSLLEEVEQSIAKQQALESAALTDPLTGLHNRQAADELMAAKLGNVRASGFPLGWLLVDIDNFGPIAERYGAAIRDQAIKRIAFLVAASCRHDDFVARYSDTVFAVLLSGANPAGTIICGEKVLRNVRGADWTDTPIGDRLTVSIGAACVNYGSGLTLPDLMQILDAQLEQAKSAGGNCIIMNTRQITGRLTI